MNNMNKLFELSEEQKNEILKLHESYKSVHGTKTINEQRGRVSGIKMTDPGAFDISRTKTKETGSVTGQEGKGQEDYFDPNSDADKQEALTLYGATNNSWKREITSYIWDKIKWWDRSSKKAFQKIMSEVPQIIFNTVAEINRSDAGSVLRDAERVVIEDLGEKTTTTPGEKGDIINYPGFNSDDVNESTSNFFADNKWEPTQSMINYVQKYVVEPVVTIYNEAQEKTKKAPVIFLKSLDVSSSVSRFLNSVDNAGNPIPIGDNPDRMSFETLSTKRADATIAYLKTALAGYVNWDDTAVTKDTKGTNGDGSSGPDPYKEAESIIKNPSSNLKDYKSVFSSPGFRQKYDQYKYTKFNIVIGVVPIPEFTDVIPPEPGKTITEKQFKILFFKDDTDWNFELRLPKFDFKYTSSAKAPGFWKISDNVCEQKWWQRIVKKYFVPKGF